MRLNKQKKISLEVDIHINKTDDTKQIRKAQIKNLEKNIEAMVWKAIIEQYRKSFKKIKLIYKKNKNIMSCKVTCAVRYLTTLKA